MNNDNNNMNNDIMKDILKKSYMGEKINYKDYDKEDLKENLDNLEKMYEEYPESGMEEGEGANLHTPEYGIGEVAEVSMFSPMAMFAVMKEMAKSAESVFDHSINYTIEKMEETYKTIKHNTEILKMQMQIDELTEKLNEKLNDTYDKELTEEEIGEEQELLKGLDTLEAEIVEDNNIGIEDKSYIDTEIVNDTKQIEINTPQIKAPEINAPDITPSLGR